MQKVLSGKVAIITGANQGFGLEVARKYVLAGADVMLCARNTALLRDAQDDLVKLAETDQKIFAKAADVSVEYDVQALVSETISQLGGCDILVNNAGIYGPKGEIEEVDWSEWIKAIEINVYGSILMCRAILPHFKAQGYGKIIQLSGGGATNPIPRISAYAVSKAAIVRFAETLAEEVRGTGIDVNAIAPGALNTRMLDEVLEAGPEKVGQDFYERSLKQKESGGIPLSRGADLALFLASSASDGITGKLISAVWDDWEHWPEHRDELSTSDVYTLRRITGRDRGFAWGDK
ncbi:(S)-1-phenylethanol dehydrogenase Ped [Methyloglobulus morosus KoM1]|uniref:(S)-1-phenylethanol dehydrogenase Ped n=1 Tax=Methyloglobulus morosus KoM1 TaxID=1116472 RepID=V5DW90_9GAMM|nr:SDR family oxidoreductase [Methyloglobulus morosus]ESS71606.1 (S)-1-phenylethanol dehydrogenase Ped [Methyloglobulus morosus KoM1]